ncbi:MAG: ZIP family metal transporter [Nitrososphaerales archaeon]
MAITDSLGAIAGYDPVLLGLLGGVILASFNAAGSTPVLFMRDISIRFRTIALGFAAGVMLAASFTSLVIPGIEIGGPIPVLVGIVIGALVVSLSDRLLPHLRIIGSSEIHQKTRLRAVCLFAIAVTIHNIPEGLAVGIGFGSGDIGSAVVLMLAIGTQNIPEGLAIAFSLLATAKYSKVKSYLVAVTSGLVEVPMSVLGAWAVVTLAALLPIGMGFAAGAMIFVIVEEVLPEMNIEGSGKLPSYGLMAGLVIMLALDTML